MILRYFLLKDVKHFVYRCGFREEIYVEVELGAKRKFNCQEQRVFHFMSDIGSC